MKRTVFVVAVAMLMLNATGIMAQLTLPYVGSATSSGTVFHITQGGAGYNGVFQIANTNSSSSALTGVTTGLGIGVHGKTYKGLAGVKGESVKINGIGLYGIANTGAASSGVYGYSTEGRGVVGVTQTGEAGVKGGNNKTNGAGVMGIANIGSSAVGVLGSSTSGYGVKGEHNGSSGTGVGVYGSHASSGYGMYGYAPTGVGVYGHTGSGIGVYGVSGASGYAGRFYGKVHVQGQITKEYSSGTQNQAVPIAYGTVDSDGTILSGTPNFTVTWDAAYLHYAIGITGESFFYGDYTTIITPVGAPTPLIASNGSIGGKLTVYLNTLAIPTQKVQGRFNFVVYKSAAN